mgnify:CR=1 FL=1
MATLNAIHGHPQQNSYLSIAEADAYFASRLNSTDFTGASEANKTAALIEATSRIDAHRFVGTRMFRNQALDFPRQFESNELGVRSGTAQTSDTTYVTDSNLSSAADMYFDDYFNYWAVMLTSGNLQYQLFLVTDFDQSDGKVTAAFGTAPSIGSSFTLVPPPPKAIRDAVCEEAIALIGGDVEDVDPKVKAFAVGNYSETRTTSGDYKPTLSSKARAMIDEYISRTGVID